MGKKSKRANTWKSMRRNGYKMAADGKGMEHHQVYKKAWGAYPKGWHIHHIDCNKTNNDPSNLIALPPELHALIHEEMSRGTPGLRDRDNLLKLVDAVTATRTAFVEAKRALAEAERRVVEAREAVEKAAIRTIMRLAYPEAYKPVQAAPKAPPTLPPTIGTPTKKVVAPGWKRYIA